MDTIVVSLHSSASSRINRRRRPGSLAAAIRDRWPFAAASSSISSPAPGLRWSKRYPAKLELLPVVDDDDGKRTNTHAHALSKRPAAYAQSHSAKRENRSESIGRLAAARSWRRRFAGWKHGDQTRAFPTSFRDELRVCTIIQHFWGARAHTHTLSWPHRDRHERRVPGFRPWNQTLARQLRESEHYFDYTAFFLLFLAQLLIHLSFSPLFPFLSSSHVFLLLTSPSSFSGFSGLQSNRDGMMMILLISITILFFLKLLRTDFFPPESFARSS